MKQQKVKIINKLGLHARPAAEFVKLASKFTADIYVLKNDRMVNGKSIMGVMTLAAENGCELTIRAEGTDEDQALEHLMKLVEDKFYEE